VDRWSAAGNSGLGDGKNMASQLTQDGRLIKLDTPLGKDKLLVQSF
jgi:hypothetical protein